MCCVQVLGSKLLEQETSYRQLSQEQLDNFTLDMNTAYARLKGMEEAIDSEIHTPVPFYLIDVITVPAASVSV